MTINPMEWPTWAKLAAIAVIVGAAAGGIVATTRPSSKPVAASSSVKSAPLAPAASSSASQPPQGLSASCQVASDGDPVSQQNYDGGGLDYLVAVANGTSSPVTVSGLAVTFSAFGGTVDNETPTVNSTLMEPGEQWKFDLSYANAPQVSENTYLNETCAITEVDTGNGQVSPAVVNEPNGRQNTQAQNNQNQEQQAQSDVNKLTQDTGFSSIVSQIGDDVQSTQNDLSTTRQNAASGNGDQCINASTTVYNDAATTVYNDVLTTVYNDVGTAQTDIASVRSDISTVQSDQAALKSAGLPGTPGTGAAISAAQSAIASAVSTINAGIDHANSDLDTAYQIANSVGTGPCAGDGPGNPPSGLSHIK
jgi:hypothetical protein